MSLNKTLLIGNLTRDPELRFSTKGTAFLHFSLAVTTTSFAPNTGEKREETSFIDCTVFGKGAEQIAEGARKGTPLFVEGRLKLDQWEDKQTHQKRSKLGAMVEVCRLAQPANGEARPSAPPAASAPVKSPPAEPANEAAEAPPVEDDCPF